MFAVDVVILMRERIRKVIFLLIGGAEMQFLKNEFHGVLSKTG